MNTNSLPSFRSAAMATAFFLLSVMAYAKDAPAASRDRASDLLASKGVISVMTAKPRGLQPAVRLGLFRNDVMQRLGQPDEKLPDGTLVYDKFIVEDSKAVGSLIVRFSEARVSALTLVTPAIAAKLTESAQGTAVAANQPRR